MVLGLENCLIKVNASVKEEHLGNFSLERIFANMLNLVGEEHILNIFIESLNTYANIWLYTRQSHEISNHIFCDIILYTKRYSITRFSSFSSSYEAY